MLIIDIIDTEGGEHGRQADIDVAVRRAGGDAALAHRVAGAPASSEPGPRPGAAHPPAAGALRPGPRRWPRGSRRPVSGPRPAPPAAARRRVGLHANEPP